MDRSAMKLHFFWHMHQPSYVRDDVITMPWVFLHAIKDYFDMPYLVEKAGVKATFNLSATLIEQIKIYETAPHKDKFLALWHVEPARLSQDEKQYLLKIIKSINSNLIINNDFAELLRFDILDDKQFINLEVLFLLSWCGEYLKEELASFIGEKEFFQNDKEFLFHKLIDFIKTILPYYEKLAKEGTISLFTTPYAHPIMPLLLDIKNAKSANPLTILPSDPIDLSDDALKHIVKAKQIYKDTFGVDTNGFWPAEGSVDEESVKLYANNGIGYIATDEAILHRSGEMNHYLPYVKEGVVIFFRDHSLSDLIGFKYKALKTNAAVRNFISSLPTTKLNEVVSIILDGENAWEFYPNGGYDFLEQLYSSLAAQAEFIKAEDIELSECKELKTLKAGSWIHANFNTWIGDDEKNRAWEYLFETKKAYNQSGLDDPKIEEKFLLAECSDWFWWYGEGHYTDFAFEFDELFRKHLIDIYKLMDKKPPSKLILPIAKEQGTQNLLEPKNYITPTLDGRFSSIFEWHGAGVVFEDRLYSTMEMARVVEKLYFGVDESSIYFAIIGDIQNIHDFTITIEEEKMDFKVNKTFHDDLIEIVTGSIIEIKIDAKITKLDIFHIRFNFDTQIVPLNGGIRIDKNNNFSDNWFI
jgi:alpha-amylase/alpha-mannosidase (GH57 family)